MECLRAGSLVTMGLGLVLAGACGPGDDVATSQASADSSGPGSSGATATDAPVTATSTGAPTTSGEPATSSTTSAVLDSSGDTATATEGAEVTTDGTTSSGGDVLELDPQTLVYFELPIGSIRYAVGGHDPARDTCVSIIFSISGPIQEEPHCDDFDLSNGPSGFPYVLITPAASPPCEQWDYAPNVEAVAASGCVQLHPFVEPLHIDIDMAIEVDGQLFTGTILVNNQAP
jgi:hypothetical protein